MMEPGRRTDVGLVWVAMLAWTGYCLFFLLLINEPAVQGASEVAAQGRFTIIGGWLAGLAIGIVAIFGLRRQTFDSTPRVVRVRLAVSGVVLACVLALALSWAGLLMLMLFLWGPLVAGNLLLTGWASAPPQRQRLRRALVGWSSGFAAVTLLWFVLPPGTLGFHFWTLLALVSLAAATWWVGPFLLTRAPRGVSLR